MGASGKSQKGEGSKLTGVQVRFHGAAGTVTGSCLEFSCATRRVLVDCGMFQGTRSLEALNHEPLPFDAGAIDAVILSHAHLDHSGRLPYLIASGCRARIWCTPPTADMLGPLLLDSAKLQEADADRRNRRADRARRPAFRPLYSASDVETCLSRLATADYCEWHDLGEGCGFRLWDARHIVGSASVELMLDGVRILVSGDIGAGRPIACASAETGGYDFIVCEATYGDRNREPVALTDRREELARHIEETLARSGNLLIPAFAIERTLVVIEDIVALFDRGRLKPVNVFVDSPLAERVTRAALRHRSVGSDPFDRPNLRFTHDVEDSKKLNTVHGAVIIAGSGMCEGGRIRHHLIHNLPHPESRVLMVGYQVKGTLGAVLRDGARHVRISGHDIPVNASIRTMDSYSSHADQNGLIEWIRAREPLKGRLLLVHGEAAALEALQARAATNLGLESPIVPALGECWGLTPQGSARRTGRAREDFGRLVAPSDWMNQLAAIKAGLDDQLAALPDDRSRERVIAAMRKALAQATPQTPPAEPPGDYPR